MSRDTTVVDRLVGRIGGQSLGLTVSAVGTLGTSLAGTGLRFVIQLVLARWLGSAAYGLFVVGRSWGELLAKAPDVGYQMAAVRELPAYAAAGDWPAFRGFVRRTRIETWLWGALLTVLAAGGYVLVEDEPETAVVVGIMLTAPLALEVLERKYLQGSDQYMLARVLTDIVQPIVFVVLLGGAALLIELDAVSTLVAYVAATFLVVVAQSLLLVRTMPAGTRTVAPDDNASRSWRRLGLRMFPGQLAIAVLNVGDVLVVGAMVGATEAGLYAVASRVAVIGRLVNSGLESVVSPRISSAYAEDRLGDIQTAVDQTIRVSSGPTIGFAAVAALLAGQVLSIFGAEFVDATPVLWILLVGNVSNALTGPSGYVVSLTGQEGAYSVAMVGSAVVLIALAFALVGPLGIVGVAAAQSGVTVGWNLVLVVIAQRSLGVRCYPTAATFRRGARED